MVSKKIVLVLLVVLLSMLVYGATAFTRVAANVDLQEFSAREYKLKIDKKDYALDYGDWGKCSHVPGNRSLVIFCDSRYDGNNDGVCSSGESCVSFIVSKSGVQRVVRNSADSFSENDESFFLEKLSVEVSR